MKKIGIGYEDYKRFIDENMYYIDKTLLIRDVVEKGGEVTLFTRPRRFGKTLALSTCLKKHHGENVIVLIDEYDVPLENAYYEGFYKEMVGFIRSLFESVLKTNDALKFGVVTGCLRISKESIFTGLNHLQINFMRDASFAEGFGFTQLETEAMLRDYGITDRIPEAKKWYNGYLFGDTEIYNPWSVIKFVDSIVINGKKFPEPYWANTSSNTIIKDLVWNADEEMKRQLDVLISGGTIEKRIHEDITYDDIHESEDNLWNFLFFTGYMRKVSERKNDKYVYMTMRIPNIEIASIYDSQIRIWFEKRVKESNKGELNKAVFAGRT